MTEQNKYALPGSNEELRLLIVTSSLPKEALYATSLIAYCLRVYPNSKITLATSFASAPLFAAFNRVDIAAGNKDFPLRYFAPLLAKSWDVAINLSGKKSFMFSLLRCKNKISLDISYTSNPVVQMAEAFDLSKDSFAAEIALADEFVRGAERRLFKRQHVIAVAPYDDNGNEIIPMKELIGIIKQITMPGGLFPSSAVAVLGFEQTRKRAEETILKELPDWQRVNLVGSLGLLSMAAVLSRCRFYIGGDSIVSHIAAVENLASIIMKNKEAAHDVFGRYTYSYELPDTVKNEKDNKAEAGFDRAAVVQVIDDIWHGKLKQK